MPLFHYVTAQSNVSKDSPPTSSKKPQENEVIDIEMEEPVHCHANRLYVMRSLSYSTLSEI